MLALAVALELNIEDTTDLLKRAGLSFSPGSKFDLITEYFIKRGIYHLKDVQNQNYMYFYLFQQM